MCDPKLCRPWINLGKYKNVLSMNHGPLDFVLVQKDRNTKKERYWLRKNNPLLFLLWTIDKVGGSRLSIRFVGK